MSAEENKALARRAVAIWTTGSLDDADAIYAADYVNHLRQHLVAEEISGAAAMKAFAAEFRRSFPDSQASIEDQVAEGDKVVTRFTSQGTHGGRFMGVEPTGRGFAWTGVTIDRIAGGRIAESWANWDMLGNHPQFGAVSSQPPSRPRRDGG